MATDELKWKIKKFLIFLGYIFWEPFRQLAKPRAWMYVFFVVFFVALLRGKKLEQIISFFIMIFLVMWTEWDSGKFMEEYRKKYGKHYKTRHSEGKNSTTQHSKLGKRGF